MFIFILYTNYNQYEKIIELLSPIIVSAIAALKINENSYEKIKNCLYSHKIIFIIAILFSFILIFSFPANVVKISKPDEHNSIHKYVFIGNNEGKKWSKTMVYEAFPNDPLKITVGDVYTINASDLVVRDKLPLDVLVSTYFENGNKLFKLNRGDKIKIIGIPVGYKRYSTTQWWVKIEKIK